MTKPMGNRAAAQMTNACRDCARSSASVFGSLVNFPQTFTNQNALEIPISNPVASNTRKISGSRAPELRWNVGPGQMLGGEDFAPMRKCERGGVAGKVGECEHELTKRIADLQPRPQGKSRGPCQQQGRGCPYADLRESAAGRSFLVENGLEGAQGHGANQISLRDDAGRTGGDCQSRQQTGRGGRLPRGYRALRHDDSPGAGVAYGENDCVGPRAVRHHRQQYRSRPDHDGS